MSPVWQPVQNPPQLDKFCYLSHDAQIVMAALHRKYLEKKKEILHSKTQLPGASDYYRAMYAEKFGVSVQQQCTNEKQDRINIPSVPSFQRVLPQTTDNTERSGSTVQSTPGILRQTAASCETLDLRSVASGPSNHFCSKQSTPTIHQQPPNSHDLPLPLSTTPKKLDTCRALFPAMKSTREFGFFNNNQKHDNYSKTVSHEKIESLDNLQRKSSANPDILIDKSPEISVKSDIFPVDNSRTVIHGSPSLFSQDCDSSSQKSVMNKKSNITNTESFINFPERKCKEELKIVNMHIPTSKQNTLNTCTSNNELNRFIDTKENPSLLKTNTEELCDSNPVAEKVQKGNDKTKNCELHGITNMMKMPKLCSINDRLDDHRKIRQLINKENSGLLKQSTIDGHGKIKKKSNISSFEIPFKKKKLEPGESVVKHQTSMSTSLIDVSSLSSQELDVVTYSILKCDEVVISLIYKDGATQLREMASSPSNKKKTSSTKLHSLDEVSSIAVMPKLTKESNKVYIFQLQYKEENLHNWNKNFWENFLYVGNRKICYKAKEFLNAVVKIFDLEQTKVSTECSVLDPMIAVWLLDPDKNTIEFSEALTGFGYHFKDVVDVRPTEMLKEDLHLLSKLMEKLYQELKNKDLWDLFYYVENRLVSLLAVMELRQIKINTDELVKFSDVLKKKIIKLEKKAHSTVGHSFLLNSHAQLRQVLFEELNLASKLPQKTKLAKTNVSHQTSTSESVLTQLVDYHPLPSIVLEHRQIQKLKSTYIDGMMSCVRDGYISTHWDQTSAATGRLSSYQPNVQAIPKTPVIITDYQDNFIVGKENSNTIEVYARDPFISHEGWSFLAADFQQIELRILAHLSNDPSLLKIFQQTMNGDIFSELAAQWLNKQVKDVTLFDREQTKRVVYSVMYGAGKEKLAEYLKISPENAKAIINSFLVKFPAVNQLTRKCVEFCQKNGYTKTIFKRRRIFPNINHYSPPMRAQTERQAFNFCVQGSAADLCKAAMLQIELALRKNHNVRARLLVQIHDELLLVVADEDLSTVQDIVRTVMEDDKGLCGNMVELRVPLKISLNIGKTWGHMTPVTCH